ncbi:unnamed protein product [Arctogadus glacialis]
MEMSAYGHQNNKMFMSANKKITVKLRDKNVDLKETKDLYGRLMVLARSSRDINQKEAIGDYEFSLTPRALFAPDGTIQPCLDKSKLIHLLNKFATAETPQEDQQQENGMDTPKPRSPMPSAGPGDHTRCSKSQDSPGRCNGSSAENGQETSYHSDS